MASKKVFTDESLTALVDETKSYVDSAVSTKANSSHTHSISNVTNLQSSLDAKVPTSRTVNGKALSSNITLSASDVGAAASSHTHSSYVNQNAFSNVKVGTTTVAADTTTDTLEIAAGTGISVSGDATNDKVTITNSGVRSIATGSSNGTISVNTNGTSANVAVKGLGSAAYTASTAYDAAGTATTKADAALASAKSYTDTKIDAIVGEGASETLDTIGEISAAIEGNQDMLDTLNSAIGNKVDKVSGKGLSTNDYTTTEKNKLAGIASGAEVNQNAFSNVVVGTTTIAADGKTDTLTLVAGSNITLTPDATNDKITIAAKDTTYTLGSFGVTASASELNYTDGVTSNIQTQLDGKAPTSHASSATTYGAGTDSNYGHVKLSDSTSSTSSTSGGIAATPAAVKAAYDLANGKANASHNHSGSNITSGTVAAARLPVASSSASGIVNTSSQTFAGAKTFSNQITASGGISTGGSIISDTANAYDIGSGSMPFDVTYTKTLNVSPQNVSGSTILGGSFGTTTQGTTTTNGFTELKVGNNVASGNNGNSQGLIQLYNSSTGSATLQCGHSTSTDYRVYLPSSGGTLALNSTFVKSGSGAKAGLVPAPSTTAGTTKYLREDGTWAVPPDNNTTYTFNGAVSTIKDSNLTASRALVSNSSGKIAVSAVTSTELGYLDGVTSNVQTQLNGKLSTSGGTISGVITSTDGDIANRNDATSGTYYYGGTNFNDGAFLGLYGKDQSNYAGQFRLKADDGESFVYLEGMPSGQLRWNNKTVATLGTNGALAIADGGTGMRSDPSMLVNLASTSAAGVFATSPRPGVTGTLPIANGGTGATTAAGALTNLGIDSMFGMHTWQKDNITLGVGAVNQTIDIAIDGYVPIAIRRWEIANATTNGKGASQVSCYGVTITDTVLTFKLANYGRIDKVEDGLESDIPVIRVNAQILYSKIPYNSI